MSPNRHHYRVVISPVPASPSREEQGRWQRPWWQQQLSEDSSLPHEPPQAAGGGSRTWPPATRLDTHVTPALLTRPVVESLSLVRWALPREGLSLREEGEQAGEWGREASPLPPPATPPSVPQAASTLSALPVRPHLPTTHLGSPYS